VRVTSLRQGLSTPLAAPPPSLYLRDLFVSLLVLLRVAPLQFGGIQLLVGSGIARSWRAGTAVWGLNKTPSGAQRRPWAVTWGVAFGCTPSRPRERRGASLVRARTHWGPARALHDRAPTSFARMSPLLDRAPPHWGPSRSSLDRPSTSHARTRPQLAGACASLVGSRPSYDRASTNLVGARRSLPGALTSRDRVFS
jgi:hypothetical protein